MILQSEMGPRLTPRLYTIPMLQGGDSTVALQKFELVSFCPPLLFSVDFPSFILSFCLTRFYAFNSLPIGFLRHPE